MATVTHHIHSHYNPEDRQRLERDTGQDEPQPLPTEDALDTAWHTESSRTFRVRSLAPPRFVPASAISESIHDYDRPRSPVQTQPPEDGQQVSASSFYRSLVVGASTTPALASRTRVSPAPQATQPPPKDLAQPVSGSERRTRHNWFILRALEASAQSVAEGSCRPPPPTTPTLADMISRDPPPSPGDKPFTPPVFLSLGPSNRGWTMLQRTGWREGEAVGLASRSHSDHEPADQARRARRDQKEAQGFGWAVDTRQRKRLRTLQAEQREVRWDEDISEIRRDQIIDLTVSDDDDEDDSSESSPPSFPEPVVKTEDEPVVKEEDGDTEASTSVERHDDRLCGSTSSPHVYRDHTALLTPLPTILKADRLGIGLKAKARASATGGYRVPQKRVTHNDQALAAHMRAAERLRAQKAETGRGRRGFDRARKKEESHRRDLMAYMNS